MPSFYADFFLHWLFLIATIQLRHIKRPVADSLLSQVTRCGKHHMNEKTHKYKILINSVNVQKIN